MVCSFMQINSPSAGLAAIRPAAPVAAGQWDWWTRLAAPNGPGQARIAPVKSRRDAETPLQLQSGTKIASPGQDRAGQAWQANFVRNFNALGGAFGALQVGAIAALDSAAPSVSATRLDLLLPAVGLSTGRQANMPCCWNFESRPNWPARRRSHASRQAAAGRAPSRWKY